jgi:hypothetical protein
LAPKLPQAHANSHAYIEALRPKRKPLVQADERLKVTVGA